jgi:hypothetical protein
MGKTKQPIKDIEKEMDEEIEKDLMSLNYVLYFVNKIEKEVPTAVIAINSNFVKEQLKIAESLVSKEKAKEIKNIAKEHAYNDFKLIKRIL